MLERLAEPRHLDSVVVGAIYTSRTETASLLSEEGNSIQERLAAPGSDQDSPFHVAKLQCKATVRTAAILY